MNKSESDKIIENVTKSMEKGFIFFMENGIIKDIKPPKYGSITINFNNGKVVNHTYVETTKY